MINKHALLTRSDFFSFFPPDPEFTLDLCESVGRWGGGLYKGTWGGGFIKELGGGFIKELGVGHLIQTHVMHFIDFASRKKVSGSNNVRPNFFYSSRCFSHYANVFFFRMPLLIKLIQQMALIQWRENVLIQVENVDSMSNVG